MDVSVVIPTFRRPEPLRRAIESALSQDVALEVLVLDDSPEGSAREVAQAAGDGRVAYRRRPEPSGGNPALVRNEGWPAARGRFVHFLDDDDRVAPGAYRDVVAAFEERPGCGVVFGRVEPFGDDPVVLARERRLFARSARRARLLQRLGSRMLVVANELYATPTLFVNSACVVRREVVAAVGGYDPELRVAEDLDFYLRAIRASGFAYVDRPVACYRTGAPSIMHDLPGRRPMRQAYARIYRKYRAQHGAGELWALKVLGKAVLRWL